MAFGSVGIGILYGLIASYLLKRIRFLTVSAIKETLFIFCFGYLSYATGNVFDMSGIIALLTTGVVIAHYGWYNLSPQGKHCSSVSFQILGSGTEAFVFSYLGLTFFSYTQYAWSWQFVLTEIFIIIIGRFFGTVVLVWLMTVFCCHKKPVSWRELLFICYAGLIRGAIAFALVLKIDPKIKERRVIVTTALSLVIITTLLFGSTMGLV